MPTSKRTGGAITALTALGFLGFGLPPGSPSLGEMVIQARNNLHAPWLGLTAWGQRQRVMIAMALAMVL